MASKSSIQKEASGTARWAVFCGLKRVRELTVGGHKLGRPFLPSYRQIILWRKAGHDSENQAIKCLVLVASRGRGHEVASRPEEATWQVSLSGSGLCSLCCFPLSFMNLPEAGARTSWSWEAAELASSHCFQQNQDKMF